MTQIVSFGIIGTIGFIIDGSLLLIGIKILNFSIEISRFFSFLVAVFVTWSLNRQFTFFERKSCLKKQEYLKYLMVQTLGVIINYILFISLIYTNSFFREYVIFPLAIASLLVMFFNYYMSKKVIFK